jgi:hypothetical protein
MSNSLKNQNNTTVSTQIKQIINTYILVAGIIKKNKDMGLVSLLPNTLLSKVFGNLAISPKEPNLKINLFIRELSKIIENMEKGSAHG